MKQAHGTGRRHDASWQVLAALGKCLVGLTQLLVDSNVSEISTEEKTGGL